MIDKIGKIDKLVVNLAGSELISSENLPNDTAENTIIKITTTSRQRLDSIWLDFVNLVQDVTIKVYHKIDETNYWQYDEYSWLNTDEDGVIISNITINNDWKLTVTSPITQWGIAAIQYNYIITTMEQ